MDQWTLEQAAKKQFATLTSEQLQQEAAFHNHHQQQQQCVVEAVAVNDNNALPAGGVA